MSSLPDCIHLTEVDDGAFFANDLFRRKFGSDAPTPGRHVVAFVRLDATRFQLVSYAHFMSFGDIILVGGVCTDGAAFSAMSQQQREQIASAGGIYSQLLRFAFEKYADECEAYFGYCGDARAEEVNLRSGFIKTQHPHLLVNFHKPLHEVMQRALIAKAAAIGPF
jgi:hypothetical protein